MVSTPLGPFLRLKDGTWLNIEYPVGCQNCTTPTGITRDRTIVGYYQQQFIRGFLAQPVKGRP